MTELDAVTAYLLSKPGVTEERPFGPDTLVYKVMGKMFALLAWEATPLRVNLKCDPEHAMVLREIYPAVLPGYHMNKRHWNTVVLDGSIPEDEIRAMVDESYDLVVAGLKKSDRDQLLR
jgi:predicted DNA-binding protein (MmcQ/YjbR family)